MRYRHGSIGKALNEGTTEYICSELMSNDLTVSCETNVFSLCIEVIRQFSALNQIH